LEGGLEAEKIADEKEDGETDGMWEGIGKR
jgi:hypothetical protein